MGTTKLTRKEILAEDAVHGSIISLVDFLGTHKKKIVILAAIVVLAALGIYGGLLLLERKEIQAQEILGRGIDFYHAEIDPEATDDPYEKSADAVFTDESLKYQAAATEFSSVVSGYGYSRVAVIAHYYLGLTRLEQGMTDEAVSHLEKAANSSKSRTIGYLAQRVLAQRYAASGESEEAAAILKRLIDDPQYNLPKDDLSLQLSRIFSSEGKTEEAAQVLEEANEKGSEFSSFRQKLTAELEKLQNKTETDPEP